MGRSVRAVTEASLLAFLDDNIKHWLKVADEVPTQTEEHAKAVYRVVAYRDARMFFYGEP